ncbi:response to heat [Seminavis robusta]|uniref:Response to heat n=1 Tax=Seminavis robusta TaxID=568900 RepID=A0A9N8EZB0_9STRA|nr:response to heat [Seminavis robusta]|eukprot:Sro2398_g326090.1 response to heat (398) ;mRNA; f:1598-2791
MKFALGVLALVSAPAMAYQVGGPFDVFGRPYVVSPRGRFQNNFRRRRRFCDNNNCVDRAFEDLNKEMNEDSARRRTEQFNKYWNKNGMDEESLRQQEEWINRAFGLATDVAKGMATSPREAEEAKEAIRQSKDILDNIMKFTKDASSGRPYTPVQSEVVQDDDQAFQVSIDVPGVKADDVDVAVEGVKEKLLVVRGQRDLGGSKDEDGKVPTKDFRKVFALDSTSVIDKISVILENGVLTVTVPKDATLKVESTVKIPVAKIADDDAKAAPSDGQTFELEMDVPGVAAANIDITVEGESSDKTLMIIATRELVGKDSDGNPKKKEMTKKFSIDEIVDTEKLVATLNNGVLRVSAPVDVKKTEDFIKKIDVTQATDSEKPVDVKAPEDPTDEGNEASN